MRIIELIKRRPIFITVVAFLLIALATQDLVAALIVFVGIVMFGLLLGNRSENRARIFLAVFILLSTVAGGVAALGVPVYKAAEDELYIPKASQELAKNTSARSGLDFTGYVVSDNDNSINAVDTNAQYLTTVAATGGYIATDGTFAYLGVQNALVHTHLQGARGELVVQNFNLANTSVNADFDPKLAHALLSSNAKQTGFINSLKQTLVSEGWDGVVIDFETLNKVDQPGFVHFLKQLHAALGSKLRLVTAVPPRDPGYATSMGYDLKAIGAASDIVNVMTYNQHDPTGVVGPIGAPAWITSSIKDAEKFVPRSKLQLGLAGYGYIWGPSTKLYTNTVTVAQAQAIVNKTGAVAKFDPVAAEMTATLPDGSVMWWNDSQSISTRVKLAKNLGIEGAALWELSTASTVAPAASATQIARVPLTTHTSRPIDFVNAKGLVALTFDDGPDPAWTPSILKILKDNNVPATFFVVGQMAQKYPNLISQMVNDGDIVANHTYTHLDLNTVPRWRALAEINLDSWIIHGITGRTPQLFRSPYGSQELADTNSNAHRNLAKSLGLLPVGWNVETSDWAKPGVNKIVERATVNIPHEATVLMHDGGGNRAETVASLPIIIKKLKSEGYVFTTVDHLDATLIQPYLPEPTTFWGITGSVTSIAGYRLWIAIQDVFSWFLSTLAVLSIVRLFLTWIYAVRYSRRVKRHEDELDADDEFLKLDAPTEKPTKKTVSILIPAHNEALTIEKTLASVLRLKTLPDEVFLAENGSKDDTIAVASAFAAAHPEVKIFVREYGPVGKARALNLALEEATSELIVVLDADTVIDENFIDAVVWHFEDDTVGAVAGNVRVGNTKKILAKLQGLEYGVSLALDRAAQAELGVVSVVPGAAGAFRKTALVQVGGWPARTLVEDTDLTVLLHQAQWQIPYEAKAISYTEAPESSRDVIKQRKRWAFGSIEVVALNASHIFRRKSGRLGVLGLPWLLVSQVILPAAAPIVDIYLLWILLEGFWLQALTMLALGILGESLSAAWALKKSNLPVAWVLLLPLARFWWRSLLLVSAVSAFRRWLEGRHLIWAKITRKNTVEV